MWETFYLIVIQIADAAWDVVSGRAQPQSQHVFPRLLQEGVREVRERRV